MDGTVEKNEQSIASKMGMKVYNSFADKLCMIIIYILLIFSLIIVIMPLIFVVASSFSSPNAIASGKVYLWPVEPTLRAYEAVFKNNKLVTGFINSIIYVLLNVGVSTTVTMLAAYPLSRRDLGYKKPIMVLFIITMFFSGGMIPSYLVIKNLGMINTIWAMVLPTALNVWNIIVVKTYIQASIPSSLYESASIDGCNDYIYLIKMVVPLSKPILAVIILYTAVGVWNSYFNALIYLNDYDLYPLQMVLRDILLNGNTEGMVLSAKEQLEQQYFKQLLQYATIVVSSVPVMMLYPFAQKYFIKGVMIGSLKE